MQVRHATGTASSLTDAKKAAGLAAGGGEGDRAGQQAQWVPAAAEEVEPGEQAGGTDGLAACGQVSRSRAKGFIIHRGSNACSKMPQCCCCCAVVRSMPPTLAPKALQHTRHVARSPPYTCHIALHSHLPSVQPTPMAEALHLRLQDPQ
jgi:hypothetical protein